MAQVTNKNHTASFIVRHIEFYIINLQISSKLLLLPGEGGAVTHYSGRGDGQVL